MVGGQLVYQKFNYGVLDKTTLANITLDLLEKLNPFHNNDRKSGKLGGDYTTDQESENFRTNLIARAWLKKANKLKH